MNDTDNISESFDHAPKTEKRITPTCMSPNKPDVGMGIGTPILTVYKLPEVVAIHNTPDERTTKKTIRNVYDTRDTSIFYDFYYSNESKAQTGNSSAQHNSKNSSSIDPDISLASLSKLDEVKLNPKENISINERPISPYKNIIQSIGIPKSKSVSIKATYIDQSGRVARTGDLGAVQPKQLAKNLFNLVNITKNQVTRILTRSDAYHTEACKEYMNLFSFENLRVDEALRLLMTQIPFIGETHSIEKMLTHFTHRYWVLNKHKIQFSEAVCHLLVCSILILNSDLHSKIKMKKMTLDQYIQNIYSVCNRDEALPDKEYLTNVYRQIKKKPLPTHAPEITKSTPSEYVNYSSSTLPTKLKTEFQAVKTGALYWKEHKEAGFLSSIGNSWKLSYVTILGPDLIFHKKKEVLSSPTQIISLNHSLAKTYIKSNSRRQAFILLLITGKSYLFSDTLQSSVADWVTHINLTASLLSSLPLPLSLGNPPFYTKLLSYPTHPYTGLIKDLYIHISLREKELLNILNLNLAYVPAPDEKIAAAQSITLIQQEIDRYGKYKMMLRHHNSEFLQKFLPIDSRNLEGFQEYIENESDSQDDNNTTTKSQH